MPTFPGRVEAAYVVPSGTTVSVSNGAQSSATSVTWPAGSYYHSAAGGVSSGLSALQNALSETVGAYPTHASALTIALGGKGTWTGGYGWLMNESSGSLAPVIGATSLTAVSSPTHGTTGPQNGVDKAIGFDSSLDAFDGGAILGPGAADDLIVVWVAYFASDPGAVSLCSRYQASEASSWQIGINASYYFEGKNGASATDFISYDAGLGLPVGEWHVGIAVLDRSTGKARIGTRTLSGTSRIAAEATATAIAFNGGTSFRVGDRAGATGVAPVGVYISALYAVSGSGVATGLSANLSTALSTLDDVIGSGWLCSMSETTGRVTIQHTFWPCSIDFPNTDARSLLGFEYEFNYPATAAQMATALGYGTWTSGAGYLCNESSGNLAAAFGTPATLTASSLTYSHLGARGGNDKAISFDAGTDYADGGDNFDVTASGDLIVAWVGKFSANVLAQTSLVSKYGTPGWLMSARPTGQIRLSLNDGSIAFDVDSSASGSLPGEFHVGIAVIDRSTNTARVGTYGLRSVTSTTGTATSIAGLGSLDYAGSFRIGQDAVATFSASSFFQLSALYVVTGSGVATGLSANLSTALSNFASYMKSQTGTAQARALWFPDCPLNLADDPRTAPIQNDHRTTTSPTGNTYGLCGNEFYEHQDVTWEMVPIDRYREASATYANASFETFWRDHCGMGHAWIGPSAAISIWWNNAGNLELVGADESISGWHVVGAGGIRDVAKKHDKSWTGYWTVRFPKIVSDG